MSTIYGTNGADSLSAYGNSTELQGLDGNDDLLGYNGDDTLDGGAGDDTLVGGAGNDLYVSTQGNDLIDSIKVGGFYASGNDTIRTNLQGSRVVTLRADSDDVVEIGGVDNLVDLRFDFIDGLLTVHHKDWQTNPHLGGRLVFSDLAYSEDVLLAVGGGAVAIAPV